MSFLACTFKVPSANHSIHMATPSPDAQSKVAFGRAFLVELQRGDTPLATLFARAFVAQGARVNGVVIPGAAQ